MATGQNLFLKIMSQKQQKIVDLKIIRHDVQYTYRIVIGIS